MNKSYTTVYRIVHWAMAILFMLLLITIFLRLTWMNRDNMAGIIGPYLSENGQNLSQEQLIVLAKKIREPMWQWHIYIGYTLAGLFSLRFLLPFFGEMKLQNPLDKQSTTKEKFQKLTYIIFYVCVVMSLLTGLTIKLGPAELKETVEEIHVLSIYYLVPFIIIHLTGVFIAEFTTHKGIISRIISGKNN